MVKSEISLFLQPESTHGFDSYKSTSCWTILQEESKCLLLPSLLFFHWCHPGPDSCPGHSPAFQSRSLMNQMAWWCILGKEQQQCPWAGSRPENAVGCFPLLADRLLSGRSTAGLPRGKKRRQAVVNTILVKSIFYMQICVQSWTQTC